MVCKSCLRNVIVQAGQIRAFTRKAVQLSNTGKNFNAGLSLTNWWNREFKMSLRMMVDTGATEKQGPTVDAFPEKDEEGSGYSSGGWKSEDGKLSWGYSSFRGKRMTMEDFYDIKTAKIDGQTVCLFGIFDGHGGSHAAEYLKEHLFLNLMNHPQFLTDTKLAIRSHTIEMLNQISVCFGQAEPHRTLLSLSILLLRCGILHEVLFTLRHRLLLLSSNLVKLAGESYKQTDSDFLEAEKDTYRDDGSTASTAVLVGNHLYVANVGDSRTIISKDGTAIPLSEDHKPNRSDERKRIESAGGVIMWAGTWRVGGVLAMSRAFGNRMLKQFVVAEPEIQDLEIDEEFELLVLASDGLWDVVPNEDAVSLAREEEEPEVSARKLTEVAFTRGSADNITCIVVRFHRDKAVASSPQDE